MTTHQHTPTDRANAPGTRVNRPGLVEQYEHQVLPALQTRLDEAFPEFGWRRDPNGWHATNNTHTHERLGVRADRIVAHGDAPAGFLIHGQGAVLWTTYVNGDTPARGHRFVTAVRAIAARVDIELDTERSPTRDQRRERVLRDTFAIANDSYLSDAGTAARNYLTNERGFPPETLAALDLGVLPSPQRLSRELAARGYSLREIAASNVTSDARWAGRLVGLWNDEHGRPRTLWARTLTSADNDTPRYLYLAGARRPAVPYGLDKVMLQPRRNLEPLVLVEGVLDLHHLHARGFERVAALGGTTTPPALFERLTRLEFESVTLALDADQAGEKGTLAAIDAACRSRSSPALGVVRLAAASDPDQLLRQSGIDEWTATLRHAQPGIAWRVAHILATADPTDAPTIRRNVERSGEWLGSLGARHALDQDAGVQLVASIAGLDLEATRRAFRARYWDPTIDAGRNC